MLTAYIHAAMRNARYELMEDANPYYGEIPACPGVWASGKSLEECRVQLQEVLEDWIILGLRLGHPLPTVDGISKEEWRGNRLTPERLRRPAAG